MRAPLLQRAIDHALDSVEGVTPAALSLPTPCAGWDLGTLLHHLNDAFDVLAEGVCAGIIASAPAVMDDADADDPAAVFRKRAERVLDACSRPETTRRGGAAIADRRLPVDVVLTTVALEIAVHGWDAARAVGDRRPIPGRLALELLLLAPLQVDDAVRPGLFAPPVPVPPDAPPGDRLVAFLGRDPAS
ncbi:TIGR03086 family metal-binding protein [Actinomadura sp. NPDC047616]|uniref:TIGR03086 family metal-binding protein n=1 Tax=Actinomadura sp. NPDC047616 TaxID=3155914 RepID=UPI0033D60D98